MDPSCRQCGHPYSAHRHDGERTCKRRTLTGWSEKDKTFSGQQACTCPGYLGRIPNENVGKRGCPHEVLQGSRVCVICKEPVKTKVKR